MRNTISVVLLITIFAAMSACSNMGVRNQGRTLAQQGENNPAPPAALPSVELSSDLLYQILEAEIALQRKQYDVAGSLYLELAQSIRDPRLAETATKVAIFARDEARSVAAATLWLELDPGSIEAHQMVVVAAIRAGDVDAALPPAKFLLAPQKGLEDDGGFRLISSLLNREQDIVTAMQLMDRMIAAQGGSPLVYFNYAQFAARTGQLSKAEEAIDHCLALKPGWDEAIAMRVSVLQLQKRDDEAVTYLAGAVKSYPDNTRLRVLYARRLVDAKRFDEAVSQYEQLVDRVSPNTEVLLTLGMINLQLNRYDTAEKYLRQVEQTGGHDNDVQFYLGWLEESRHNDTAAIEHYSAVAGGDFYMESRVRVAALFGTQDRIAEARDLLKNLRTQVPVQQKRLYEVEGEILRAAGHHEEAIQVLGEALQQFPGDFDLLYARALNAEPLGRLDILEQDLRSIIERDPNNVDALNALGYTLADRTDRYEEAHQYIQRALELSPQNNAVLDSMGWVMYRLGDYKESVKYLRRSLEIKQDHEVAAHLGEVLWVSGEQQEALNVWKQALDLFPDDKILLEVMKRFGQ